MSKRDQVILILKSFRSNMTLNTEEVIKIKTVSQNWHLLINCY